jgi:hypothetical protein
MWICGAPVSAGHTKNTNLGVVATLKGNETRIGLALRDLVHHGKRKHLLGLHAEGLVVEAQETLEQ